MPLALVLFFTMFVYSGVEKVRRFSQKTRVLQKKISDLIPGWPQCLSAAGMAGVVALEIVGSAVVVAAMVSGTAVARRIARAVVWVYVAFVVVVTMLYHPPSRAKPVAFLSNLTTLGGFLLIVHILDVESTLPASRGGTPVQM